MYRINEWWGGFGNGWQDMGNKTTLVTNTQTLKLDITKKNSSWYGAIKLTYLYDTSPVEVEISFRSATDVPSDYGLLHIEVFGHDRVMIRYDGIGGSTYNGSWIGKIKGNNGTFSGINWERINESYSTTEEAIGTWIDGKPIYRKSYSFEINETFISKTLETVAIDNIIKVYGSYGGGSSLMRPVPYDGRTSQIDYSGANTSSSTEYSEVFYQATDTTLRFVAKSQSSMAKAVVVVEYTKA